MRLSCYNVPQDVRHVRYCSNLVASSHASFLFHRLFRLHNSFLVFLPLLSTLPNITDFVVQLACQIVARETLRLVPSANKEVICV